MQLNISHAWKMSISAASKWMALNSWATRNLPINPEWQVKLATVKRLATLGPGSPQGLPTVIGLRGCFLTSTLPILTATFLKECRYWTCNRFLMTTLLMFCKKYLGYKVFPLKEYYGNMYHRNDSSKVNLEPVILCTSDRCIKSVQVVISQVIWRMLRWIAIDIKSTGGNDPPRFFQLVRVIF